MAHSIFAGDRDEVAARDVLIVGVCARLAALLMHAIHGPFQGKACTYAECMRIRMHQLLDTLGQFESRLECGVEELEVSHQLVQQTTVRWRRPVAGEPRRAFLCLSLIFYDVNWHPRFS